MAESAFEGIGRTFRGIIWRYGRISRSRPYFYKALAEAKVGSYSSGNLWISRYWALPCLSSRMGRDFALRYVRGIAEILPH